MAFSISFNVTNDALQSEGRDAFASAYNWEGSTVVINDQSVPNPKGNTKQKFLEYCLKDYYKQIIRSERRKAAEAAIVVPPVGD